MKRSVERAAREISALPADDWQPHDWDTFESARSVLVEELGHLDRSRARQSAARSRQEPRGGYKRTKRPKPKSPELLASERIVRERSGGMCEARTPDCTGRATQAHHIAGRSNNTPDDLLDVCSACHSYIHAHPEESYAAGWMRKRNGMVRP
jgi:hypothetical protein